MSNVVSISDLRKAPPAMRSSMETKLFSAKEIESWRSPPFQRPLRINDKVRAMAERIKVDGGVMSGILTLGKVGKQPTTYIVDGQHRLEAFKISGLPEAIADIRYCAFDTMAEMAEEFVNLNSSLVRMRPDDVLRGLESVLPSLKAIRNACDFVGYDQIRRNGTSGPVVSMSALLRCWNASGGETPSGGHSAGMSAGMMAEALDQVGVEQVTCVLNLCHSAWGRESENYRLWANLNLTLCMWLWRRLVVARQSYAGKRAISLNATQFRQCLMSLAASSDYVDWLAGRQLSDRDRGPCYARMKSLFAKRLQEESKSGQKPLLPQPAWGSR